MESKLAERGIFTYPAAANFLLLRLAAALDPDTVWRQLISSERVLMRNCANLEALSPHHLRVSIRTEAENTRLIASPLRVVGT